MVRWKRLIAAVSVAGLVLALLAFWRSDIVAPYFVSGETCGPLQVRVESINLSAGGQRLRRSFPVNDGGAPEEERYMNAVADHAAASVRSNVVLHDEGTPFTLDLLFIQNDIGLRAGGEYDQFLTRPRFVSPWARVLKSGWSPCAMQLVLFRQGRQMARDQMEMQAGRVLAWQNSSELSLEQFGEYADEYARRVLGSGSQETRDSQIKEMQDTIPPEVLFAFINSPQATIHSPILGFGRILNGNLAGYARHTNGVIDSFFRQPDEVRSLESVLETNYQQSGYKNDALHSVPSSGN